MVRYGSIQYLRGLAATFAVSSHAFLYPVTDEPTIYGRLGWVGVILFFVISGFRASVFGGVGCLSLRLTESVHCGGGPHDKTLDRICIESIIRPAPSP